MKTVIAKGKTVEEAIQSALEELGTTADKVTTKILDIPSTGLIGMFSNRYAKVEVTLNDDTSDTCKNFLSDVFGAMGLDVTTDISYDEDIMKVNLLTDDTGVLIGRRGQTLDALQYLTGLAVNRDHDEYTKISLDVANYREKRKAILQDLADRLAQKVQRTKRKYVLEPMNPYERRIIHASLQNYKNITTYSEGEEPFRHIVIDYVRETK
jgi:spoIIIJ-associated protein